MSGERIDLLVVDSLRSVTDVPAVAPGRLPSVPPRNAVDVLARLERWQHDFAAAQAPATIKAVRADWARYVDWCEQFQRPVLPADVDQLEDFLTYAVLLGRKRTTVARYLYTVSLVHDAAGLLNPAKDRAWPLRWKKLSRRMRDAGAAFRKQAAAMRDSDITKMLRAMGDAPRDLRDAALISLASDTLMRESELVAVEVGHFSEHRSAEGWSVRVPFSKTDKEGRGNDFRYVSDDTHELLGRWLAAAGIVRGLVFRPIGGRPSAAAKRAGYRSTKATPDPSVASSLWLAPVALQPKQVARIFRGRAQAAGIDHAPRISGHSARIGTANDLINGGATTAQIQHAGGWRGEQMVNEYTRASRAGNNAVAALRKSKKRTAP